MPALLEYDDLCVRKHFPLTVRKPDWKVAVMFSPHHKGWSVQWAQGVSQCLGQLRRMVCRAIELKHGPMRASITVVIIHLVDVDCRKASRTIVLQEQVKGRTVR